MIRTALATGEVTPLSRGVFVRTSAIPSDAGELHVLRALAAQLGRPSAVAGDGTAALAWGLALESSQRTAAGPVSLLVPYEAPRATTRTDVTLRGATLPAHHVVTHPSGLVVTSAARTAADIAARADLPAALITLDSAANQELLALVGARRRHPAYQEARYVAAALTQLREAESAAATPRTRRNLSRAVSLADPRRESPAESRSFGHMVLADLPLPRPQFPIHTPHGTFYSDFAWEEYGLIAEVDGDVKYSDPESLAREKARQQAIEELGYMVIRWLAREIARHPQAVMDRVYRALAARGAFR